MIATVADATLFVDGSGIHWANGTTGKISRCAKQTGCIPSEIEVLATGQANARRVKADAKYVYEVIA